MADSSELGLLIALAIGLVIGAEREQRIAQGGVRSAGIRTFAVAALLGAVGAMLGAVMLVTLGAALALLVTASYASGDGDDPGLTSELALLTTYALGALAMERPMVALGAGISVAVLLAFRAPIHQAVRTIVTPAELRDALIVAASALVVLPLLPDATIDPYGALNPFVLWRLVVLVLSVHFAAHVARRALGPRWGLPLSGLASGFASSVATVASMGSRAKTDPRAVPSAVAAATASSIATFVQLAILIAAASPSLLRELAAPLGAGLAVAVAVAVGAALRAARSEAEPLPTGSAVNVRGAIGFSLMVALVTVGARIAEALAGTTGVVMGAALASLVNVQASAASLAAVHAAGQLDVATVQLGVLACLTANGLAKVALAVASGAPRDYWLPVAFGAVVMTAASAIGIVLTLA